MTAINFPSNPAGQTPTNKFSPTSTPESSSNGITYVYDGTKWSVSPGGGGQFGDLQSVTDAGNTTTNGATFAGNVTSGGDANDGSAVGAQLAPNGSLRVTRQSGDSATIQSYTQGNSTPTCRINGDGSAEFAGTIESQQSTIGVDLFKGGYSSATGTFVVRGNGTIVGNESGGATTGNYTYKIDSNGSATFVGYHTVTVEPNSTFSLYSAVDPTGTPNSDRYFFKGTSGGATQFSVSTNGSATFAGTITAGLSSPVTGTGSWMQANGGIFSVRPTGSTEAVFAGYQQGSGTPKSSISANGDASFTGTVTSANSFAIQLEADDDTKYTSTTDADGVETRVYNGSVLDVKERIQNVLARMDALEANELTDDATDSALLTLVANLSTRLDERDAQISAISDNADNALLSLVANISTRIDELEESIGQVPEPDNTLLTLVANISTRIDELEESIAQVPEPVLVNDLPDNALLSLVASLSNQVSALTSRVQTLEGN